MIRLIDSHAHLDDKAFADDRDTLIAAANAAGVAAIVNVGACLNTSRAVVELAARHPSCWAVVGVHPHDAKTWQGKASEAELDQMLARDKVLGVGEIGLDYHYDLSPRDQQRTAFVDQWCFAATRNKPVVIHLREAFAEFWSLIGSLPRPPQVLLHCFSGDLDEARRTLDAGFMLAIGGVLTYKKAESTRAVFRFLPLDRILLETDCPYLAPEPLRGKRNHPGLLVHTFNRLAQVREQAPDDLAAALTANAHRFFGRTLLADGG